MNDYVLSLKHSLLTENWYAAIVLALTLPDICGSIDSPGKNNSRLRYSKWFDKYVGSKYRQTWENGTEHVFMTGSDCYALRCAFLHQGITDVSDQKARDAVQEKIILNCSKVMQIHKCRQEGKVIIDLNIFCNDIIYGVETWYGEIMSDDSSNRLNIVNSLFKIHNPDIVNGGMRIAISENPFK